MPACSNNTLVVKTASVDLSDPANIKQRLVTVTFPGSSTTVHANEISLGEVTGLTTHVADPALLLASKDFIGPVSMHFRLTDGPSFPGGVNLLSYSRVGRYEFSNRAVDVTFTTPTTSVPEPGTRGLAGSRSTIRHRCRRPPRLESLIGEALLQTAPDFASKALNPSARYARPAFTPCPLSTERSGITSSEANKPVKT